MKCRQCGAEVPDTDRFCTECGNDLEKQRQEEQEEAEKTAAEVNENAEIVGNDAEASSDEQEAVQEEPQDTDEAEKKSEDDGLHCPHCGAEIVPGDKFCTKCGQSIVDEPVEQKTAQAVPVPGAPEQQGTAQQGQQGTPYAQQPYQQPVQPYAQPPYQPGQPYPLQGQYPQQPMQNGYYGQPQYPPQQYAQQPQNNFYGQPYQPNPQDQQPPQDPPQDKTKRGKTPFWVWIIIGVLAAAIIFCIVWFFAVPHTSSTNSANVGQPGQSDSGAPSRIYVDESSDLADGAVSALSDSAEETIRETTNSWRNQRLLGALNAVDSEWVGNSLIVYVQVNIDYNQKWVDFSGTYYRWYITYVRYDNVYYENGEYHYESSSRPHGKILNLYTDYSGDHHYVAGYSSEADARVAAVA